MNIQTNKILTVYNTNNICFGRQIRTITLSTEHKCYVKLIISWKEVIGVRTIKFL